VTDAVPATVRRLRPIWLAGALLAVLVAGGTMLLIRAILPGAQDAAADGVDVPPDVRMEGAELRQFGGDGRLQYAMVATDIRFFQGQGRAELTAPDVTLYDTDGTAWQIRARNGTLLGLDGSRGREDEVRLRDDVLLQPLEGFQHVRLSTKSLTLYPDRQFAATDQAVIIDSEVGRTTAAGLKGDLQRGVLKLLDSPERPVQTILLPAQFK
jgi:lipopolysaccharide export system protein LptC